MLTKLFDAITRLSLRFRIITLVLTFLVLLAGFYAYNQLNQELVPAVEFPQTIVVTQWDGAEDTEDFLNLVTLPLEDAVDDLEGVVGVESQTNSGFSLITIRNEFGLDQTKMVESIQDALDSADIPDGAEPDVIQFSLSDLPIATVSISSDTQSLAELKEIINSELIPQLEAVEGVARVTVSGGQELPEEIEEEAFVPVSDRREQPRAQTAEEDAELSFALKVGLRTQGFDYIEDATQVTGLEIRVLVNQGGELGEQAMGLFSDGNLRVAQPDALAYLPSDYTDTLDADLVAELNELAAEYGGVGQFTREEAVASYEEGIDILTGQPLDDGTVKELGLASAQMETTAEITTTMAEITTTSEITTTAEITTTSEITITEDLAETNVEMEPIALPEPFVLAGEAQGFPLETTADLTPEILTGLATIAPQLLELLTPEMLDTMTAEQLEAMQPAEAVEIEPVDGVEGIELPDEIKLAGQAQGMTLETTADLTPEILEGFARLAPDLVELLTPEMLESFNDDQLTALQIEEVSEIAQTAEVEPIALSDEWIAIGEALNLSLETTADLTPEFLSGVAIVSPELLESLTPEMLASFNEDQLAALPSIDLPLSDEWIAIGDALNLSVETTADLTPEILSGLALLSPELLEAITPEMLQAFTPEQLSALQPTEPTEEKETITTTDEPVALPASIIAAAESQGVTVETTADLSPELLMGLAAFAPQLLDELSPEMLEAMTAEQFEAMIPVEVEPSDDPTILAPAFAAMGEQAGIEMDTIDDLTPDFVRMAAGFGDQVLPVFEQLTPDNLRLLEPEAIALLPVAYLDTLDSDLRDELDGLADEFGGAGILGVEEAEAAEIAREEANQSAPALTGVWIEPDPETGEESAFQTAAQLVDSPFAPSAALLLNSLPGSPQVQDPRDWFGVLTPEIMTYVTDNEPDFAENFLPSSAKLLPPESINYLLETFPDAYDEETAAELEAVALGDVEVFVPEDSITRQNGNPAVFVNIYKEGDANSVKVFDASEAIYEEFAEDQDGMETFAAFEQASFIRQSIKGVIQEGTLGAIFAVLVILVFLSGQVNGKFKLSFRATAISGLSIPASVLFAFLLMWLIPEYVSPTIHNIAGDRGGLFAQFAKLFPKEITLNMLTLSGLTVAIGRVVDDSIVVMENCYRYIQKEDNRLLAVIKGTKEVAVAIFFATLTTMAVFLPLGFVGGVISEFFLPFGLTVTYALIASYIVSITVVPALTYLFINKENIPDESESWMQRVYTPMLKWVLSHRLVTLLIAFAFFAGSMVMAGQLPQSFVPSFGEPTLNIGISMPPGTEMIETNELTVQLEEKIAEIDGMNKVVTQLGSGGGFEALFGGGTINQGAGTITITPDKEIVEDELLLEETRAELESIAKEIFGEDSVKVTAGAESGQGGFAVIVTGDDLAEIVEIAPEVEAILAGLNGDGDEEFDLTNVSSNAAGAADGGTLLRINGESGVSFTADTVTANTIGVADAAVTEIAEILPDGLVVSQGADSEQQAEDFKTMGTAILVSIILVYVVMAVAFKHLIHPFTILFSLPFAFVGAIAALWLTKAALGLSSMMGLLLLVGVVVTNGIVLVEMINQLRDEGNNTYDALVEAGRTRLRPIWMTALTAILALIPLALSKESGAIIAAELGQAVMGGLIVSTALTLLIIPVVYSLFDSGLAKLFKRK